jgi:hypothetical protein
MSILTDARRARTIARYRILFRANAMAFGAAVFFIAIGVLVAVFASDAGVLLAGMLTAILSGLLGYKITVSTMHLIDAEGERAWRDLGV